MMLFWSVCGWLRSAFCLPNHCSLVVLAEPWAKLMFASMLFPSTERWLLLDAGSNVQDNTRAVTVLCIAVSPATIWFLPWGSLPPRRSLSHYSLLVLWCNTPQNHEYFILYGCISTFWSYAGYMVLRVSYSWPC